MRRARRGYVLVEALAAGAVLALAVAGLLTGLSQAGGHVGRAQADRYAAHRAQQELERLRTLPGSAPEWLVGTPPTPTPCPDPPLPEGWTCTVLVTQVADSDVGFPASITYRRARVTLGYRGREWSLDALR